MTYPHGLFSWSDVSLPDPHAGVDFYSGLFGWDSEDQYDAEGNYIYTNMSIEGKSVAGIGPQQPGMEGAPPSWASYINVEDVGSAVEQWTEAGGSVLAPPIDVMSSGKLAFVADPEGAAVGLWEPGDHKGAEVFTEDGSMSWNELATRDSEAARAFYANAMGWDFKNTDQTPSEYWTIHLPAKEPGQPYANDDYNGGIITMNEEWGDMPAHWMVYFRISDMDERVNRLKELGGQVAVEPFATDAGKIAVVTDPQGATFTLIEIAQ